MSSPASRRFNRNSTDATTRRSNRDSQAPLSSDPVLPQQSGSAQNTPRGNARSSQQTSQSQAPPASSPLFFRSSPANGNRVDASSPLRQQAVSSDGGRTPRATGGIGGDIRQFVSQQHVRTDQASFVQILRPFTTHRAPIQLVQRRMAAVVTIPARQASSYGLHSPIPVPQQSIKDTILNQMCWTLEAVGAECSSMRMA